MKTRMTEEETISRIRLIIASTLAFTLIATVMMVLYSLIFVTQPMQQSPNDAAFFDLIKPVTTFVVGALSGALTFNQPQRKDKPNEETAAAAQNTDSPREEG
jgi:chromate transport protein ChrA